MSHPAMDLRRTLTALAALAAATLLAGEAAAQRPRVVVEHHHARASEGRSQLVFEAGAARPLGDLDDDFETTDQGLEASAGYQVGGRFRYFLTDALAISPAFHYTNFGDDEGVFDDGGVERGFEVATSVYRYAIDVQHFFGPADALVRPYASLGIGLYHNRYWDFAEGLGVFETASDDLGFAAGIGVAFGPIEVSGSYDLDRAKNDNLPSATDDDTFSWDHVTVRAGFALGRF